MNRFINYIPALLVILALIFSVARAVFIREPEKANAFTILMVVAILSWIACRVFDHLKQR
jgi:hypothetical protein